MANLRPILLARLIFNSAAKTVFWDIICVSRKYIKKDLLIYKERPFFGMNIILVC